MPTPTPSPSCRTKKSVQNYTRLTSLAEKEGLFALKMKMEEQAADEDAHGQEMQRLLG